MSILVFNECTSLPAVCPHGSRLLPGFFRIEQTHKENIVAAAKDLAVQSTRDRTLQLSRRSAPADRIIDAYTTPIELMAVDFALSEDGQPQLIELQAFSSIHATMLMIEQQSGLNTDIDGMTVIDRIQLFQQALDSGEGLTVILDITPLQQMTTFDFLHAATLFGVTIASLQQLERQGDDLYLKTVTGKVRIATIWNRIVPSSIPCNEFDGVRALLSGANVRWIGHMDHFFSVSKASMPFLSGHFVPPCDLLSAGVPSETDIVVKPLYDFGGQGVDLCPNSATIQGASVPSIWQKKIAFSRCVQLYDKAFCGEIRVMLFRCHDEWLPLSMMLRASVDGRSNQTGAQNTIPGGFAPVI